MKPMQVDPVRGASQVAVCVATRRRPERLERLLQSLQHAKVVLGDRWDVRAYVVDNDPGGSALEILDDPPSWVHLFHEPREGIPFARNRTLKESLPWADWIAFVDDDEVVSPTWLAELLRVQRSTGAHAVAGPVIPLFDEEPPGWIRDAGIFDRPRYRTGRRLRVARTGNVLVKATALDRMDRWFDPRFAFTGASDTDLFERFNRHGFRIVWSDDALVYEHVPTDRMRLQWFLQREFRIGNNRPVRWRISEHDIVTRFFAFTLGSLFEILAGIALVALGWIRGIGYSVRGLGRVTRGLGSLLGFAGLTYEEYQAP